MKFIQFIRKIASKILFPVFSTGLILLPFFFWPWYEIPYEVPRVYLFLRWVEVLTILLLLALPHIRIRYKTPIYIWILIIAFFASAVFSSLFGVNDLKSMIGNYYRWDGLFTLAHLICLFFIAYLLSEEYHFGTYCYILAISSIIMSIGVVSIGLFGMITSHTFSIPAIATTFGNSKLLSGYLAVTLPTILYGIIAHKDVRFHRYFLIGLIIQIIAIGFTHALGGLVCISIFILGYIFVIHKKKPVIFLILSIILLCILSVSYFQFDSRQQMSFESRQRIFTKAIMAWSQKPIFGWGYANFDYAFESVDWPLKVNNDVYVDKAHAQLLEILVTMGLVGLSLYCIFLGTLFYHVHKYGTLAGRTLFLIIVMCVLQSELNVTSVMIDIIFWSASAFFLSHTLHEKDK
ncbi:MAG: O-antigen ligase family protein [Candidatus Roizmanbacteria bacterium]